MLEIRNYEYSNILGNMFTPDIQVAHITPIDIYTSITTKKNDTPVNNKEKTEEIETVTDVVSVVNITPKKTLFRR